MIKLKRDERSIPADLPNSAAFKEASEWKFALNREPVVLPDRTYVPGELFFLGYYGDWQKDGSLVGAYVFRLAQPGDGERDMFDFNQLPGLGTGAPAKPKPKKRPKAKAPMELAVKEVGDGDNAQPGA